jgi:hypothetical protein
MNRSHRAERPKSVGTEYTDCLPEVVPTVGAGHPPAQTRVEAEGLAGRPADDLDVVARPFRRYFDEVGVPDPLVVADPEGR